MLAARRAVVTVEEIVDDFGSRSPNAVILPAWTISAVVHVPGGAHPSYAHGYSKRDNGFYIAWDKISRERERFLAWMAEHVTRQGLFAMSVAFTPTEIMTIAAARTLRNDDVCFVGIGAPSAACNLARLTHAPGITLIYESGTIATRPQCVAAVDRRRRIVRDRIDDLLGAGNVPVLVAGRPRHRRLPWRRTDRSLRQSEHHRRRNVRAADGATARRRWRAGDRNALR